jgi:hypothetical protein
MVVSRAAGETRPAGVTRRTNSCPSRPAAYHVAVGQRVGLSWLERFIVRPSESKAGRRRKSADWAPTERADGRTTGVAVLGLQTVALRDKRYKLTLAQPCRRSSAALYDRRHIYGHVARDRCGGGWSPADLSALRRHDGDHRRSRRDRPFRLRRVRLLRRPLDAVSIIAVVEQRPGRAARQTRVEPCQSSPGPYLLFREQLS